MSGNKAVIGIFKKTAFTLAEVLITLGIIGVVAALTMPSLIQNKQNKVLEAQFKKSYSVISQAFLTVINEDYGGIADFNVSDLSNLVNNLSKRYKDASTVWPVLPDYPNNSDTARTHFLAGYYKNFTGKSGFTRFNDGIIQINDGSTIYFDKDSVGSLTYGIIFVALDVNGWRNKPNRYGYDFFVFTLEKNGRLVPMGGETSLYPEKSYCSKSSNSGANGYGCTVKALTDAKYFSGLK